MLSGLTSKQAKTYAIKKLKSLKMWSLRNKSPNSFSSGQKKKILLAQALIHNPEIIIMDEPVANLDPKARIEFFDLLMQLRKKGKAIFISSHVLAELDLYADSATILDGGEIIYDGDKKSLMAKFSNLQYKIATENDSLAKQYLHKNQIPFSLPEDKEGIIVEFQNETLVRDFQKFLLNRGVSFLKFTKLEPTLDQVYNKLIIKGSVDTQEG